MKPRTWTCCGCEKTFESYTRDAAFTRKLCGLCVARGQNMTRIMIARREMLKEQWKRNERWETQRRKLLGFA